MTIDQFIKKVEVYLEEGWSMPPEARENQGRLIALVKRLKEVLMEEVE